MKINIFKRHKKQIKLTDLVYIAGDYSMFRSECWFACAKNKQKAIWKLKMYVMRNPHASGFVVGSLSKMKQLIKDNKGKHAFYPNKTI